ncbi:MAG TPA: transcriptional regulator [Kofleriaceae bacterium]
MIKPIRTERDHARALARIEQIFAAKQGTPEFDELDVLATLVEVYERAHHPIEPPTPVEAIKFRIEQGQVTRAQLNELLGGRAKVAEVLNKKRALSKSMVVRLHAALGIPYESLLGDIPRSPRMAHKRTSRARPRARMKIAS